MMNRFVFLFLAVLLLISPTIGFTQTKELKEIKKDIEELKKGQEGIQKEIQEIKKLLQTRQAPTPPSAPTPAEFKEIIINVKNDPFKGSKEAKLAIIEIFDYQCPFCARHVRETLPQIDRDYIKTGKLIYIFKDFPLEAIHPQAFKAAEAAECSREQDKYWEMHDMLFANMRALGTDDLLKYATTLGLDIPKFQQCLESGKYAPEIRSDMEEARKAGISGTPGFLLGFIQPDGKVRAVSKITGARPYAAFKEEIDRLLSQIK